MIADFRYDRNPAPGDISVRLYWDQDERMGEIILPEDLERSAIKEGLPNRSQLPVISAVAYAMVLAAHAGRKLKLTGDESAWQPEWGELLRAY